MNYQIEELTRQYEKQLEEIEEEKRIATHLEPAKTYAGINQFNELTLRDRKNKRITQGGIHKFWNWFIDICLEHGHKKIGVCAPMEHGKTNQISLGRILHFIGMNPSIRIKLVSCIDSKATEKTNAVKNIIEFNEDYKMIFPNIKPSKTGDSWTGHRLVVERPVIGMVDATLESQSITAEGIGGRCDVLVFDDPVSWQNSTTELQRAKIRELANTTWLSRIDDEVGEEGKYDGIVLYVGTAWHEDDLMHYWMQKGSNFIFLKMGISEDFNRIDWEIMNGEGVFDKPEVRFKEADIKYDTWNNGTIELWEKKPKEVLLKKFMSDEEGEGQRFFDRAYRNKFVSSEEQIFYSITKAKDMDYELEDIMNESNWDSYMGVDLAISKRTASAYTVWCIGRTDPNGYKYLVDVFRGKFSSPSTAAITLALGTMYDLESGIIENNAYQQSMLEWIDLFNDDLNAMEGKEMNERLNKLYSRRLSKDIDISLWEYIKPSLMKCNETIVNFKPYTTGKSIMDEAVGLPAFAAEIQTGKWIIPWKNHTDTQNDKSDYCGCGICIAIKELIGYPGAKYKDCLMAWFFLSRAMKAPTSRIRRLNRVTV